MQLMISVLSAAEAQEALTGGADILDVKNPAEGSLGAQFPGVIRQVAGVASGTVQVSAAIGDLPDLPGTAALAALGAAACGVDYVKVGLRGARSAADAVRLLGAVQAAVAGFPVQVIAGVYADYERAGTLEPRVLPQAAAAAGVRGCLLDTAIKDGRHLFDFITPAQLQALVDSAHAGGLLFSAAGALSEQHLGIVRDLGVDVVGVRSAACRDNRRAGPLDVARVRRLRATLGLEVRTPTGS